MAVEPTPTKASSDQYAVITMCHCDEHSDDGEPDEDCPLMATTTLYRFYAANGDLLYVGIAKNPILRMQQHRADKPWWTAIASSTYTHYSSRAAALEAETAAIKQELPRCNIAGIDHPRGITGIGLITVEHPDWIRLERLDSRLRVLREQVQEYDPCDQPHTCSETFWHQEIRPKLVITVGWGRTYSSLWDDADNRYLATREAWDIANGALSNELEDCTSLCELIAGMEYV